MKRFVSIFNGAFIYKKGSLSYRIKQITGFYPRNINLYKQALTHKSLASLNAKGQHLDNERLEFLGDAVLDTVLADYLFRKYPYENEGFLTQLRSKVVNRKQLGILAKDMRINELLDINKTRNYGHTHIYGNAFEAFIGAIYLDKGFAKTQNFIINKVIKHYIDIKDLRTHDTNYKSQILEWSQKENISIQFHTEVNPQKENTFVSFLEINSKEMKKAIGFSKKEAEQNAAFIALKQMKIITHD